MRLLPLINWPDWMDYLIGVSLIMMLSLMHILCGGLLSLTISIIVGLCLSWMTFRLINENQLNGPVRLMVKLLTEIDPPPQIQADIRVPVEEEILDQAFVRLDLHPILPPDFLVALGRAMQVVPAAAGVDVHDHKLQTGARAALLLLLERYPDAIAAESIKAAFTELKEGIFVAETNKLTPAQAELALTTLNVMQGINGTLGLANLTESQCLGLVWARIQDPVNRERRSDLIANLYEQLADASIAYDQPYCLTGRVTRILQCLELDAERIVSLRCLDTVREELASKVGALRRQYFEQWPERQSNYDNGDKEAERQLRNYILRALFAEYRQTAILTQQEFADIIPAYLAEL